MVPSNPIDDPQAPTPVEEALTDERLPGSQLQGERLGLIGPLAGMSKRDAARLIRRHGGMLVELADETCTLLVLGEAELPLSAEVPTGEPWSELLQAAAERGSPAVLRETDLWQRLGLVDVEQHIHRLYTPAMLAELLGVSVAVIRRWHRKGLIVPAREVHRLPYFEFGEVATARRLAELLAAGCSPRAIQRQLDQLQRYLPSVERPLAQLSVIVEGKQLLLRQGEGLVEPGGQFRFDFRASEIALPESEDDPLAAAADAAALGVEALLSADDGAAQDPPTEISPTPVALRELAAEFEDQDRLDEATEMYRAALAAGGPDAETNFRLAELLYRRGDAAAARERYYAVLEIDEDYVEARANLGCVLAELDEPELAVAAFRGALSCYPEYADVHYHLARILDELGHASTADAHWREFLRLAAASPWADEARQRLGE